MKRKRMIACLVLLSMAVSFFSGSISSQAKKKSISLNRKKITETALSPQRSWGERSKQ